MTGCHNDIDKEKQKRDKMSFLPVDAVIGISGKLRRKEVTCLSDGHASVLKGRETTHMNMEEMKLSSLRR